MTNSLTTYWPLWIRNCEESARWLRSGEEYEQWHIERNIIPLSIGEREARALQYDKKAKEYKKMID